MRLGLVVAVVVGISLNVFFDVSFYRLACRLVARYRSRPG